MIIWFFWTSRYTPPPCLLNEHATPRSITCMKRPLNERRKNDFNLGLHARETYGGCRLLRKRNTSILNYFSAKKDRKRENQKQKDISYVFSIKNDKLNCYFSLIFENYCEFAKIFFKSSSIFCCCFVRWVFDKRCKYVQLMSQNDNERSFSQL